MAQKKHVHIGFVNEKCSYKTFDKLVNLRVILTSTQICTPVYDIEDN